MRKMFSPMKAALGSEANLKDSNTIFEPKLDGIRALCYVNKEMRFFSRNGIEITSRYPELAVRSSIKAKSALLDGEIIVLDPELAPRFSLWQQGHAAVYVVFDLLMLNGTSVMTEPLLTRKNLLQEIITPTDTLELCLYTSNGPALWKEMVKRDMEGVVAKRISSLYEPGIRSKAWLKIKAYKTLEAIIIGYTSGKRTISSLLLGIYDKKTLLYIGKVGTGFSDDMLRNLYTILKPLETKQPPVATDIQTVQWVKPQIACEIKYQEMTTALRLRHPVFLRLRPDKNRQEITFQDQGIKI